MTKLLRSSAWLLVLSVAVLSACPPSNPREGEGEGDGGEGEGEGDGGEGEVEGGEGEGEGAGEGEGEFAVSFVDEPPALLPVDVDVIVSWEALGSGGCEARSSDDAVLEVIAIDSSHATIRGVAVGAADVSLVCARSSEPVQGRAVGVWTSRATLTSPTLVDAGEPVSADAVVTGAEGVSCALQLTTPLGETTGDGTSMSDGSSATLSVLTDGTAAAAVVCEVGGLSRSVNLGVVAATPVIALDSIHIGDAGSLEFGYHVLGAKRCRVPSVVDAVVTLESALVPAQADGVRALTIECENDDVPALIAAVTTTVGFGNVTATSDADVAALEGVSIVSGTLRLQGAIRSLAPLDTLVEVGALDMLGTGASLTSLAGLENVSRIAGALRVLNTNLVSLSDRGGGLIRLAEVGEVDIGSPSAQNRALTSVSLPLLTRVGLVFIGANPQLVTVSLPAIATAPQLHLNGQPALTSIRLDNLTQLNSGFILTSCGAVGVPLVIVAPLLQSVGGLSLTSNAGLQELSLPALHSVAAADIFGNDPAVTCDNIAVFVCGLDSLPSVLHVSDSGGVCFGGAAPTCP